MVTGVEVGNGLFTIGPDSPPGFSGLDFNGGAFNGDARWLEIAVCCAPDDCRNTANFTMFDPRQELTPAPYALAMPGLWTQNNTTSPNIIGGYSGNSIAAGIVGATIAGGGRRIFPMK